MKIFKRGDNMSSEKEFLNSYSIKDFERPSLTTDLVIFSLQSDFSKKTNKKKLSVLLVQRENYPFKDKWALPGGFCVPNENVYETAIKTLKRETGIEGINDILLTDVFSDTNRDPRGWIISNSFRSLISPTNSNLENLPKDRWNTKWFNINLEKVENDGYQMILTNEDNVSIITTLVSTATHQLALLFDDGRLAFDHAKIILSNILRLRNDAKIDAYLPFDLVSDKFTLYELQNAFEETLGRELTTSNFRRDISKYVEKTDETTISGFRPANLYIKKEAI